MFQLSAHFKELFVLCEIIVKEFGIKINLYDPT